MKERCREVLERAYLFLDGEVLNAEERVEIEVHLKECAPCLDAYGLQRDFVFITTRLKGKTVCPDRLKARIVELLDEI
ncbi:MAG TPA: zf-HC2 domain-containing protein [Actinomycetota bacterium]|nr:zf-HC2 domain-containing protein [Actinomycetota bacterium]